MYSLFPSQHRPTQSNSLLAERSHERNADTLAESDKKLFKGRADSSRKSCDMTLKMFQQRREIRSADSSYVSEPPKQLCCVA